MKGEDLIREQMKTISKLQDDIKVQNFEIAQLRREKRELSETLKRRNENIKNVRVELSLMKRTNDYSNINKILAMLPAGWDYED